MLTKRDVISFSERLKFDNKVICLHSSFKSFGNTENGPNTIIDGLIESGATILAPSFYYHCGTAPQNDNPYMNNGIDYSIEEHKQPASYEDSAEQIDSSMGIIPKVMLRYSEAIRSRHPENSFVAIGSYAKVLTEPQSLLNVYAPYKLIYKSNIPAVIVLAGVNFTSCTPIHFAEELVGRGLFRRWGIHHGKLVEYEVGSCSDGFEKLAPYTKEIEKTDVLGDSPLRIYDFNVLIDSVVQIIRDNPDITHCENPDCMRCNDMILGGRRYR